MTIKFFPSDCSKPVAALAFDYGTQRIGVSFGQSISATAKAIAVIKAKDGIPDWDEIETLLIEWKPDLCVVGLPYNLDGSESVLLVRAIKFAHRINGRFNLPCHQKQQSKKSLRKIRINSRWLSMTLPLKSFLKTGSQNLIRKLSRGFIF